MCRSHTGQGPQPPASHLFVGSLSRCLSRPPFSMFLGGLRPPRCPKAARRPPNATPKPLPKTSKIILSLGRVPLSLFSGSPGDPRGARLPQSHPFSSKSNPRHSSILPPHAFLKTGHTCEFLGATVQCRSPPLALQALPENAPNARDFSCGSAGQAASQAAS